MSREPQSFDRFCGVGVDSARRVRRWQRWTSRTRRTISSSWGSIVKSSQSMFDQRLLSLTCATKLGATKTVFDTYVAVLDRDDRRESHVGVAAGELHLPADAADGPRGVADLRGRRPIDYGRRRRGGGANRPRSTQRSTAKFPGSRRGELISRAAPRDAVYGTQGARGVEIQTERDDRRRGHAVREVPSGNSRGRLDADRTESAARARRLADARDPRAPARVRARRLAHGAGASSRDAKSGRVAARELVALVPGTRRSLSYARVAAAASLRLTTKVAAVASLRLTTVEGRSPPEPHTRSDRLSTTSTRTTATNLLAVDAEGGPRLQVNAE